jgi:hypothetical protein
MLICQNSGGMAKSCNGNCRAIGTGRQRQLGLALYLTVFVTGLAMRLQWISLPENLQMLDALANPWILRISALGALAEFFADKILWLDSISDTIHTAIRPPGGALLALAVSMPVILSGRSLFSFGGAVQR